MFLLLPLQEKRRSSRPNKTSHRLMKVDKKRKKQSTVADANRETQCWKARFLKAEAEKEMLRVKLEIVEDLMSDHTCENYS
jgi:hypothetical protein